MTTDIGERSRDLRQFRIPDPTEPADSPAWTNERRIQIHGAICRYTGIFIIAGTVVVVTALPERYERELPVPVAMILGVACLAFGGALVVASLVEWLSRYGRAQSRRAIDELAELRESVAELAEKIPSYQQGYQRGVEDGGQLWMAPTREAVNQSPARLTSAPPAGPRLASTRGKPRSVTPR